MIRKQKGTLDIFPDATGKWQYVENVCRETAAKFGFGEIRIPTFEATELFSRGVGNTTDVVQKEMYTFTDRSGDSLTLRPEGTAGVARALIENKKFSDTMPIKLYYIINCFRHEAPQAGRFREFEQFGVELFGSASASADADIIALANSIIKNLGIEDVSLKINSIGCPNCRGNHRSALKEYFSGCRDELCDTCKTRLETNPMRILDCKSEICKKFAEGAPKTIDYLCDDCKAHMDLLEKCLDAKGIKYEIDTSIVRGLDYYTRTVFEFVCGSIGAQSTICGGGRYDGLVSELDGPATPACGFGMGISRLLPAAKVPEKDTSPAVYLASMGEAALVKASGLAAALRDKGIYAECDLVSRSLKAQMKYADKIGAKYTVIIGDSELESGKAQLRSMADSTQQEIEIEKIVDFFN
ncbi:MAG: histidine--tRNA ligase [Ruminococcaceae bacterium]|nr:histidine--tRNA ligase [Oscillospiraceae bacterium]